MARDPSLRAIATVGMAVALVLGLTTVSGSARAGAGIRPVRHCGDLLGVVRIPGAVTHVEHATEVGTTPSSPGYCLVDGFVEPAVRFELKLPTRTYAGRYVQYGCDGLCGVVQNTAIRPCGRHGGDMAVAATDDGHVGAGAFPFNIMDGRWAAQDQAARDDYFYRGPHVVSLAAKKIIAGYYGAPPRRSYFNGCSTGGREGLLLAQRYPRDFDGIVAGSPTNYMGPLMGIYMAWLVRSNQDASGGSILSAGKLAVLHRAVVGDCDRLDGLVDGQIDDPRACGYDPARLRCPTAADQPDCLTPAQVRVVRKLYQGPVNAKGVRLYPGWQSRGSEEAWNFGIVPDPVLGSFLAPLPDNYLRYLGYPIGAPHSSLAGQRFTVGELKRLTAEGAKGNALSLDLGTFRRAGGKLLLWHGWDDQSVPSVGTLDYYQRLSDRNGGLRATRRWARTFMVPTKYHCALDGYRLTTFDPLDALVAWIEHGDAPDRIIASELDPVTHAVLRTRPVFPYPLRARYDGSGSIDDAGNFVPAAPRVPPRDAIRWAGEYLHLLPGPRAR